VAGIVFVILLPVLLSGDWLMFGVDQVLGIPVWPVLLYSVPLSLGVGGVIIWALTDIYGDWRRSLGVSVLVIGFGSFVVLSLFAVVLSCLSLMLRQDQMFCLSAWHVLLWSAPPSLFLLFMVGWFFNDFS